MFSLCKHHAPVRLLQEESKILSKCYRFPPLWGHFKLNFDLSAIRNPGVAGMGGIIHDNEAKVLSFSGTGVFALV